MKGGSWPTFPRSVCSTLLKVWALAVTAAATTHLAGFEKASCEPGANSSAEPKTCADRLPNPETGQAGDCEIDAQCTYHPADMISIDKQEVSMEINFNRLVRKQRVGSSCGREGLGYAIHDSWTTNFRTYAVGDECSNALVGQPYNPSPGALQPYDCNPTLYDRSEKRPTGHCKVGDLSGKFGPLTVNGDGNVSKVVTDPGLPDNQDWTANTRSFVVYCSNGDVALCGAFVPTAPPCAQKTRKNYCNDRGDVAGVHLCVCTGCALGYDGTNCEVDLNAKPKEEPPPGKSVELIRAETRREQIQQNMIITVAVVVPLVVVCGFFWWCYFWSKDDKYPFRNCACCEEQDIYPKGEAGHVDLKRWSTIEIMSDPTMHENPLPAAPDPSGEFEGDRDNDARLPDEYSHSHSDDAPEKGTPHLSPRPGPGMPETSLRPGPSTPVISPRSAPDGGRQNSPLSGPDKGREYSPRPSPGHPPADSDTEPSLPTPQGHQHSTLTSTGSLPTTSTRPPGQAMTLPVKPPDPARFDNVGSLLEMQDEDTSDGFESPPDLPGAEHTQSTPTAQSSSQVSRISDNSDSVGRSSGGHSQQVNMTPNRDSSTSYPSVEGFPLGEFARASMLPLTSKASFLAKRSTAVPITKFMGDSRPPGTPGGDSPRSNPGPGDVTPGGDSPRGIPGAPGAGDPPRPDPTAEAKGKGEREITPKAARNLGLD